MASELLLGIDVGTSSVRACIFTPDGRLVGSGRVPYDVEHPHPGWAEVNPEVWWQGFLGALAAAFRDSGADARLVKGVGISALFPTVIPFDNTGNPLAPAILYCDQRSTSQAEAACRSGLARTLEARTSNRVTPGTFSLMSHFWLKDERRSIYERTSFLGAVNTLFSVRLAGVASVDYTSGLFSGLCDAAKPADWSNDLLALTGVNAAKLPPLRAPGQAVGGITAKAAELTGLVAGTSVAAGAGDVAAASFGGGCIAPERILYTTGSSDCVSLVLGAPPLSPLLANMGYLTPETWLAVGTSTSSGAALDWFARSFLGADSGAAVARDAARSPAGAGGVIFLPYLQGERTPIWDPLARGVFHGLTLSASRADLARAVLEGTAFALRHIIETMEKEAGVRLRELPTTGGGARNDLWNRIKTDVIGIPLRVFDFQEFSALGAAMLGGMASGLYGSYGEAVSATASVRGARTLEPQTASHNAYEAPYRRYLDLYPAIRGTNRRAGAP